MAKPPHEHVHPGAITSRLSLPAVLEGLPVGVLLIDGEGAVVGANSRMAALVGLPPGGAGAAAGRHVSQLLPEGHKSIMEVLRVGESSFGLQIPEIDGLRLVVMPLDGGAKGVSVTAADLEALGPFFGAAAGRRGTNRLHERAADGYSEGLIVCDSLGTVVHANEKAAALAGAERRSLEGRPASWLAGGLMEDSGIVLEVLSRARPASGMARLPRTGKGAFVSGFPVMGHDERLSLAVFTLRDLSLPVFGDAADGLERELFTAFRDEVSGRPPRSATAQPCPFARNSNAMLRTVERASRLVRAGLREMLLLGEPGSGKRALARYMHESPVRTGGAFVRVPCADRDSGELEIEIFGVERSKSVTAGLLEAVGSGTVYLEDADALPLKIQKRLLEFLGTRKYTRSGGSGSLVSEATVMLSSSGDLESLRADNLFLAELHEALDPRSVSVPPLRNRREDIIEIAREEVSLNNRRYGLSRYVDPYAAEILSCHSFPGNVRELKSIVHQSLLFSETPNIGPFIARLLRPSEAGAALPARRRGSKLDDERPLTFQTVKNHGLSAVMDSQERRILIEAIENCKSTREMASKLRISQAGVARKLKKFKLQAPGKNVRK
ncbi:MAG: sigma 54-interacting transcriptional regulator [Deltaproteobacteria bacterium]|jgi:DNA-binding NtrC family response regulator/PAS domain-containing protein|nr:sigma 54-interacting transcriptional regulator [Deltaproteobacteria bacterium]